MPQNIVVVKLPPLFWKARNLTSSPTFMYTSALHDTRVWKEAETVAFVLLATFCDAVPVTSIVNVLHPVALFANVPEKNRE